MADPPAPTPHRPPLSNRDFDFFYQGLGERRLLVQRCDGCATLRCPPGPVCPACQSFAWTPTALTGLGRLFSYTVHCHPPLRDFAVPLPIGLAEMDEGIRMIAPMDDTDPQALRIGQPIETLFVARDGVPGYRFRPVAETRR